MINQVKKKLRLTLFLVLSLTFMVLVTMVTTLQSNSIDTQNNQILTYALPGIESESI